MATHPGPGAGLSLPPPLKRGLSRSSRSISLAPLAPPTAVAVDPSSPTLSLDSPSSSLWDGPSRNHSPFSAHAAHSTPPSSAFSGASSPKLNPGFVVLSRGHSYQPPPTASSSQNVHATSSLPPSSPPAPPSPFSSASATPPHPGAPLSLNASYNSSFRSHPPSPPTSRSRAQTASSSREATLGGAPLGHATQPSVSMSGGEPKTTHKLSSSHNSQGRRMINQYVRLKLIGQGSHGTVWLCAEPNVPEGEEEDEEEDDMDVDTDGRPLPREEDGLRQTREGKGHAPTAGSDDVTFCAIKSVAREGPRRGKSLRHAKGRKAARENGAGGIGADDKVKREVAIMKRLDHKNVVRLKEVIDDAKSKKVFMVLEFMAGGQIVWQDEEKRPTMTVDEARRTFRDVVLGLEYLHYQGIIHRDIKPANLLWTADHSTVKISDFGVSHVSEALLRADADGGTEGDGEARGEEGDDDRALRKTAGSPAFFAPELCHSSESTLTPQAGERESSSSTGGGSAYFSAAHAAAVVPGSGSSPAPSSPTTPSGVRLTGTSISPPRPRAMADAVDSRAEARARPTIGKGIDVWALGVTLFCLLFGDTPFTAETEYELYNVIVGHSVKVPLMMGRERAWTGVGIGWEGCGNGVEGREVVDLLSRLLEKDPLERIGLAEVKQHPFVLRNLSLSPDAWLFDTDPSQTATLRITDEEVQQATQERGAVAARPPIRSRPGLREALHAALVRFPVFASRKKRGNVANGNGAAGRSRSKSASSTSQSYVDGASEPPASEAPSRHPSDGATSSRKKISSEYGIDIRRIISGGGAGSSRPVTPAEGTAAGAGRQRTREPDPATAPGGRGLVRSLSASSFGTSLTAYHTHRLSTSSKSRDPSASSTASARPASPARNPSGGSDTESAGRRVLKKMFSRLGGGGGSSSGRRTPVPVDDQPKSSLSDNERDHHDDDDAVTSERAPYVARSGADATQSAGNVLSRMRSHVVDDDDVFDASDFEYSSDEDDEDEFAEPPLRQADAISGWHAGFGELKLDAVLADEFGQDDHDHHDEAALRDGGDGCAGKPVSTTLSLDHSTPRASAHVALSTKGLDPSPSKTPPPLVREHSDTPGRAPNATRSPSGRDGSIRSGFEPPGAMTMANPPGAPGGPEGSRRWDAEVYADAEDDDEDEEEGTEIFLAPRRRRAGTLVGSG